MAGVITGKTLCELHAMNVTGLYEARNMRSSTDDGITHFLFSDELWSASNNDPKEFIKRLALADTQTQDRTWIKCASTATFSDHCFFPASHLFVKNKFETSIRSVYNDVTRIVNDAKREANKPLIRMWHNLDENVPIICPHYKILLDNVTVAGKTFSLLGAYHHYSFDSNGSVNKTQSINNKPVEPSEWIKKHNLLDPNNPKAVDAILDLMGAHLLSTDYHGIVHRLYRAADIRLPLDDGTAPAAIKSRDNYQKWCNFLDFHGFNPGRFMSYDDHIAYHTTTQGLVRF